MGLGCSEAGISQAVLVGAGDLSEVWFDTTCLKPNIHFPVDWVLLTDVVRTLMKAVAIIRKHGLRNRMPGKGPEDFLKRINQLAINMANSRRRKDGKKKRMNASSENAGLPPRTSF